MEQGIPAFDQHILEIGGLLFVKYRTLLKVNRFFFRDSRKKPEFEPWSQRNLVWRVVDPRYHKTLSRSQTWQVFFCADLYIGKVTWICMIDASNPKLDVRCGPWMWPFLVLRILWDYVEGRKYRGLFRVDVLLASFSNGILFSQAMTLWKFIAQAGRWNETCGCCLFLFYPPWN